MAKFPEFDEEFKQNVSEKFHAAKDKLSDALLTDDGSLDTEKIGNAVSGAAKKVEDTVREGYRKFSDEYIRDGELDKDKLGEAASRTYRKAGRSLATGVSRLADFLTDKFGVLTQDGEIVDAEIVTETEEAPVVAEVVDTPAAEETPVAEEPTEPLQEA